MFIKLLLIFTIVPMIELTLLIKLGSYIGVLTTIILVAVTGIVGVSLAKSEGFIVINKIRTCLSQGKMPADSLIEGVLILIGGTMLLTPGLLTDITGFSLIIPISRPYLRKVVKSKIKNYIHINKTNDYYYDNNDDNYYDISKKDFDVNDDTEKK
ncbi:MAG: FxsA family protein [Halanaerobiales bacterium]